LAKSRSVRGFKCRVDQKKLNTSEKKLLKSDTPRTSLKKLQIARRKVKSWGRGKRIAGHLPRSNGKRRVKNPRD